MKEIRSRDNTIYRSVRKLRRKKYRDLRGMYLLEGVKPLKDAAGRGADVEHVFFRMSGDRERLGPELSSVVDPAAFRALDDRLFSELSETENSQGVIAAVRKNVMTEDEFLDRACRSGDGCVAVMDGIQDPGNAGTIIRTAEAAGYTGVMVTGGGCDVYSPKTVRAAAGSLFRMPVLVAPDPGEAAEMLKCAGMRIAAAALEGAVDCFRVSLGGGTALVIGNEGRGVSGEMLAAADIKVKIPMEGSIESINAAVAAGILMYRRVADNKLDER